MTPGPCLVTRQVEASPLMMDAEQQVGGGGGAPLPLCPCSSGLVSCSHSFSHHVLRTQVLDLSLISLSTSDATWPEPWTSIHQNI